MNKAKDYIQLHLNILLFSLTSVFSKAASVQLNRGGIKNPLLYVFLFLIWLQTVAFTLLHGRR